MRIIPLVMLLAVTAGCAGHDRPALQQYKPLERPYQTTELVSAVKYLEKGDAASARKLLSAVCDSPPMAGVTDEALFRLAVLSLKPSTENTQAHLLLRRLRKEFPASPWTEQAQPLEEQLSASDDLRRQTDDLKRQNKNYRSAKEALAKEIGELRDTVEQLNKNIEEMKHLDLELGRQRR